MKISVRPQKRKNHYSVVRGNRVVGRLRYWGASREDAHEWDFQDRETKVFGSRPGISKKEYLEIIDRFYEKKERSQGFVQAQDEITFMDTLDRHAIRNYWHEGPVFFFDKEEDLLAARLLL